MNEQAKPCVVCEKAARDCRCNFKTPRKSKWNRKSELWSTSPRKLRDIMQELADHFPITLATDKEFIFKFSLVELKLISSPATSDAHVADEIAGARKESSSASRKGE